MKTTIVRLAFLFFATCAASSLHAQTAATSAAQPNLKETQRMTPQAVIDFLNNFEALARKKNFDLVSDMVHERAIFRFNDGDFVGRPAIRAAFEKTWASSSGTHEQEKFYLSDIVVVATDTNTAAATYNRNWEGVSQGKSFRIQGRGTRLLVREGDRWQIIHEHLSRMPKP
jgi:ketosteroid isomerase-like protein